LLTGLTENVVKEVVKQWKVCHFYDARILIYTMRHLG
jgi:hypothetical protein